MRGIKAVAPGPQRSTSIGRVIESYAKRFGYGVVRDFTGHGIGTLVPLRAGRPALRRPERDDGHRARHDVHDRADAHARHYEWDMWDDGWTVVTRDLRRPRSSSTPCS